jgi:hypothetical protein
LCAVSTAESRFLAILGQDMVKRTGVVVIIGLVLTGCATAPTAQLATPAHYHWTAPLSSGALAMASARCAPMNQVGQVDSVDTRARTMTISCVAPTP